MQSAKPTIEELWTDPKKHCSLCDHDRNREEFPVTRRHGKWVAGSWCKSCCRDRKKRYYSINSDKLIEYSKKYVKDNREKVSAQRKQYREANKETLSRKKKEDYRKNENKRKATGKEWRRKNANNPYSRERNAANAKRRRTENPEEAIKNRLRHRVWLAVRDAGARKHTNTMTLVGCSIEAFLIYLEKLFKPGMTWENRSEWHIDHIRPCASFNLIDPEQQKICFHYTNLQPLWAKENLIKSSKYENKQS